MSPKKILAIHFKLLGDLVLATAALRALKEHFPDAQLHVATAAEAAPLISQIPWISRVWAIPRRRGSANLRELLPLVKGMRSESFDVSIDLVGNDRGAYLGFLVGAIRRVGVMPEHGYFWRRWLYTQVVEEFDVTRHESVAYWNTVSVLGTPLPDVLQTQIFANPQYAQRARSFLGDTEILCFVNASQAKKEWPAEYWARLYGILSPHYPRISFTGGNRPREAGLQASIKRLAPGFMHLPPAEPLDLLVAAIAQVRGFVSNDTGALHFAAALGVPTIGLFGPTASTKWGPLGVRNQALQGALCTCSGHVQECASTRCCLRAISPERVADAVRHMLSNEAVSAS